MEAWLEKRHSIPMKESSGWLPLHFFEQRYKTLIGERLQKAAAALGQLSERRKLTRQIPGNHRRQRAPCQVGTAFRRRL